MRCSTFLILYEAEKEKKTRKEKRREKHIVEDGGLSEKRETQKVVGWSYSFGAFLQQLIQLRFFLSFVLRLQ